jgi:hypothetical protein
MVPLPVVVNTSFANGPSDVEIYDETGVQIGMLCICRVSSPVDSTLLSDHQYAAFINDVEVDELGGAHRFRYDYAVIDEVHLERYLNDYLETAPIWGGFLHKDSGTRIPTPSKRSRSRVTTIKGVRLPTKYHREALERSILEPFAFERYLKTFHLLELLFDWHTFEKIKALGDDLFGFGRIITNYDNKEISRLKSLLHDRCDDLPPLVSRLNAISGHLRQAKVIFFEYGKDGNPIKEWDRFETIIKNGGFVETAVKKAGLASNTGAYENFVREVAAYWIYRIRCSIAHSRIGEYIMTNADEDFVIDFCEPLLQTVLIQALSK